MGFTSYFLLFILVLFALLIFFLINGIKGKGWIGFIITAIVLVLIVVVIIYLWMTSPM